MYDYLCGEQVKVFYSPIFDLSGVLDNEPVIYHSGGSLRGYGIGDELPIQTSYYKYPEDFIIFDYRFDRESLKDTASEYNIQANVFVVKKGKLKSVKWDEKLVKSDLGLAVVDNYGRFLNISTLEDFKLIKNDFREAMKSLEEREKKLFPNGLFKTMTDNFEEYESKRDELIQIREETIGAFNEKWIDIRRFEIERSIGEWLDCIQYFGISINNSPDPEREVKDIDSLTACIKKIKEIIEENPDAISRYVKWQDKKDLTVELVTSTIKLAEEFLSQIKS